MGVGWEVIMCLYGMEWDTSFQRFAGRRLGRKRCQVQGQGPSGNRNGESTTTTHARMLWRRRGFYIPALPLSPLDCLVAAVA